MAQFRHILNHIESYLCRFLLSGFVCLLFLQICSRVIFGDSITWVEELSVYMFVWFVFFGASYAAKMGAHNRVTFQFRFLKPRQVKYIEAIADLFWLFFNVYFVYLAIDFIFNRMNQNWVSQTLDIKMKYIYLILPIAFTLMTIRILQVNYQKLILNKEIEDPDKVDLAEIEKEYSPSSSTLAQR